MEKIININFSGSAIAIDEQAHEKLKNYLSSLNTYFKNEESKDEIMSDIESRIGELCVAKLKDGKEFIADEDIEEIMNLMGRPADLGAEEEKINDINNQTLSSGSTIKRGKLVRNGSDKIVSGVASGIANYFAIDPAIIRILFILFGINGLGLLLYIIFWAILPMEYNLPTNIYRRLYRNTENKMIAGVASGLATYFKVDIWIPRIIFLSPIILSMFFSNMWGFGLFGNHGFHMFGGNFFGNSFGSMFFLAYFILWIVLPEAKTDLEKKALRGEAMDINSIKENVKQFGSKIESVGNEIGENVKRMASDLPRNKSSYSSIGNIIGLLIKGFILFIVGIVLFTIAMMLFTGIIGGAATLPLRNFFLNGFTDQILFYLTILGLFVFPLAAIILWIVRIFKSNKNSSYRKVNTIIGIGITIGFFSGFILAAKIGSRFKRGNEALPTVLNLPSGSKDTLLITANSLPYNYKETWFDINNMDLINGDSLLIRNTDVYFYHTTDSSAKVEVLKYARGNSERSAENSANIINYNAIVNGNTLNLDEGFVITSDDKFKAQKVRINIYLPIGKKVKFDAKAAKYLDVNNYSHSTTRVTNSDKYGRREYYEYNYGIDENKIYYVTENDVLKEYNPTKDKEEAKNKEEAQKKEAEKKMNKSQLEKANDSIEDAQRKLELKKELNEKEIEKEKERLEKEKEKIQQKKENLDDDQTRSFDNTNPTLPLVNVLTHF